MDLTLYEGINYKPIDISYCYKYYLKWTETDITDVKRSHIKAL